MTSILGFLFGKRAARPAPTDEAGAVCSTWVSLSSNGVYRDSAGALIGNRDAFATWSKRLVPGYVVKIHVVETHKRD